MHLFSPAEIESVPGEPGDSKDNISFSVESEDISYLSAEVELVSGEAGQPDHLIAFPAAARCPFS